MRIRTYRLAALFAVAAAPLSHGRDNEKPWPPQAYPETRYAASWKRNPFNLKTVPVKKTGVSFAANLAIAGISVVGDQKAVILVDRTNRQYQRVTMEPNQAGISLVSISQDSDITKVIAEIARDGEKAEVRYELVAKRKPPENDGQSRTPKADRSGNSNQPDGRGESEKSDGR